MICPLRAVDENNIVSGPQAEIWKKKLFPPVRRGQPKALLGHSRISLRGSRRCEQNRLRLGHWHFLGFCATKLTHGIQKMKLTCDLRASSRARKTDVSRSWMHTAGRLSLQQPAIPLLETRTLARSSGAACRHTHLDAAAFAAEVVHIVLDIVINLLCCLNEKPPPRSETFWRTSSLKIRPCSRANCAPSSKDTSLLSRSHLFANQHNSLGLEVTNRTISPLKCSA